MNKIKHQQIDMDSTVTQSSNKPVSSGAVYDAIQNMPTPTVSGVVKYDVSQSLTNAEKTQARNNIGAGTSNFNGNYNNLTNKPNIPVVDTVLDSDSNNAISNKAVALAIKALSGRTVNDVSAGIWTQLITIPSQISGNGWLEIIRLPVKTTTSGTTVSDVNVDQYIDFDIEGLNFNNRMSVSVKLNTFKRNSGNLMSAANNIWIYNIANSSTISYFDNTIIKAVLHDITDTSYQYNSNINYKCLMIYLNVTSQLASGYNYPSNVKVVVKSLRIPETTDKILVRSDTEETAANLQEFVVVNNNTNPSVDGKGLALDIITTSGAPSEAGWCPVGGLYPNKSFA